MRRRTAAASRAPEPPEPAKEPEDRKVDSRGYDLSKRRGRRPGQIAKTPPARTNIEVKTPAQEVAERKNVTLATQLKLRGQTFAAIAERLGIAPFAAAILVRKGLDEYRREHKELVADEFAEALARIDRMMRSWEQAAHGYTRVDSKGEPELDPVSGEPVRVAPDPKAAKIFLDIFEARMKLLGLANMTIKVEHGGKDGGPIRHAHLHLDITRLTEEQLAHAQGLRGDERRRFLAGCGALLGAGVPEADEATDEALRES